MRRAGRTVAALAALAVAAATGAGCGDGEKPASETTPPTRYEAALASVGEGVSPTGVGFGWIDLSAAPGARDVALALAPGPSAFLAHPGLLRAVGLDAAEADAATSVTASYGYGVRLDGVDPGRLARRLREADAKRHRTGEWTEYDIGGEWEAQLSGPLAPLRDYAARVAVAPDSVILARTASSREALEDRAGSALDAPSNRFAASCLGDVDSARIMPGNFTHNAFASPELIAIGTRWGQPADEVLCAIGDDRKEANGWAAALEQSLARGSRDPLLGTPIGRSVAGVRVERVAGEASGLHAARAELTLTAGQDPGFLYGALVRGSILPYVGAPPPIREGTRLKLGDSPNSFK